MPDIKDISWGHFGKVSRIGRGGMGDLFLVEGETAFSLNNKWVLKRIHSDLRNDPLSRALFIEEAQIHSSFDHPHIVNFLDFGAQDEFLYMALEYMDGGNLSELSSSHTLQPSERLRTGLKALLEISSALSAVHEKIIHQDISPANILYSKNRHFKLCDFGVAEKINCPQARFRGLSKGKFRYMSPEQICGTQTDGRSDIFSLGACFAEFFSGERLYPNLANKHLPDLLRHGSYLKHIKGLNIPASCSDLIFRCVQPCPEDRFQSASELNQEVSQIYFRAINTNDTHTTKQETAAYQLVSTPRANKWAKLASLILALPILAVFPIFKRLRKSIRPN